MDGMSVEGRRGQVRWKGGFTGIGQQLTYDTFQSGWTAIVPITLGEPVHIWDIPLLKYGGPCKAILLKPAPEFKRGVLVSSWIFLAACVVGGALFLLALKLFVDMLFVPAAVAGVASLVIAGLGFWYSRGSDDTRHIAIRLLLGFHEWGGSDPATWDESLTQLVVDPKAEFGSSFAALAERERAAGNWGEAMWAARLCAATEDETRGEALTDAILADPQVAEPLKRVRKNPGVREAEFGSAPGLAKWLTQDPAESIHTLG